MTPRASCSVLYCSAPVRSRGWCRTHYDRWKRHGDPLALVRPRRHVVPPTCSEDDCGKPVDARGLCSMHYRRLRLYGSTADRTQTRNEAFWSRVDRTADGCWPWGGTVRDDGYGIFQYDGDRSPAHRVAYELAVGSIPEGLDVDHRCHKPDGSCPGGSGCAHRRCVRPEHLAPATRRDNVLRGVGPSAQAASRDCCSNGHAYTEESTYWYRGYRMCKTCWRER